MPFNQDNMSLQSGYPGKQMFTYHSADTIETVAENGYFNDAISNNNLTTGDIITVVDNGTPTVDVVVVTVNGSMATVTNGT
ncbi:hypothetical protein GO013_07280 [Pseudodesulfovibrio sp. JC047]|uniref:hypothetical protein n=1 Tax=Pseudodesulfovibrio sp. JC047 TaxID=2683199 RepID=UPI0013D05FD3|nr:hypothetical protein [Pseudodesulfovibrio sp. JC047]NDV19220.1 hypothetical protein [Pseudodesulfovibrio sp. JC047]